MYTCFLKKRECSSRPANGIGDCLLLQFQCFHKTHIDCTHTGGPTQSHTPIPKEARWGYSKGYTLAVHYNTHANMGGAGLRNVYRPLGGKALRSGGTEQDGSNPAPSLIPPGRRLWGNHSFWFLETGSFSIALAVLEHTLL